jgi:hypothetical protein
MPQICLRFVDFITIADEALALLMVVIDARRNDYHLTSAI